MLGKYRESSKNKECEDSEWSYDYSEFSSDSSICTLVSEQRAVFVWLAVGQSIQ